MAKAGILEVADVFVVNKADRAGAPALMAELKFAVHLAYTGPGAPRDIDWEVPVLATEAQAGAGITELFDAIAQHRAALTTTGALHERRRARRREELRALLVDEFMARVDDRLRAGELATTFQRVADDEMDPYSAAQAVLAVLSLGPS
jgi:LAO/AO transport system kinase